MLGLFIELKFCMTAIYFLNYHKKFNMFVYKFASVYFGVIIVPVLKAGSVEPKFVSVHSACVSKMIS